MDPIYAPQADEMLAVHGFRRTPGRIALLKLLAKQGAPVTAEFLEKELAGTIDRGNLYRAIEAFTAERMLARYDFGHGHAHYELAGAKPHHHHVICERCGKIEDVPANDRPEMTRAALKAASGFKAITRHSLEFYGICTTCAS